ncbi:MAG: YbjN domain-containing protein [Oscillospiraceae bacterium]|nr:YbjN domain-containing protein [Oscillospiraceae bacterium]
MNALLQSMVDWMSHHGWQYKVQDDTHAVIRITDERLTMIKNLDISVTVMPESVSCRLVAWGLVHVSDERRAEAEALCNNLNAGGIYSAFYIDNENDINSYCRFLMVLDRDGNPSQVETITICRTLMLLMSLEVNSVVANLVQISS